MPKYRFNKMSDNVEIQEIQRQIEDNFAALDENGDLRVEGDIHGKDGHFDAESIFLGNVKISAPVFTEEGFVLQAVSQADIPRDALRTVSKAKSRWVDPKVKFKVTSKSGSVSATLVYAAVYNDMVLGGDYLAVTLPTITSKDIGKSIGVTNSGTLANIVVTPTSATIYGQATAEVVVGDTYDFVAMTTSTWRLV